MKEIKGSLGVNKEQLIALLGSTMYRNDIPNIAVKELIQNSFDAVKIAKSINPELKAVITINTDTSERTITVKDNGIGMTPDIVLKAFFTIGGSYKGDNVDNKLKSGGLGLAKMAFLFSSEWVDLTTVHDGQKTHVRATASEIQADDFHLKVTQCNEPNGTEVTVKIPYSYVDKDGETRDIWFPSTPTFLNKKMIGDVEVVHNGNKSNKNCIPDGYIYVGRATANFGDLDIYISPNGGKYNISYDVLISGLFQFQKSVYHNSKANNIAAIVNILPSVSVQSSHYPINNQREGFRSTVSPEVDDLETLLKTISRAYERGQYAAAFSTCLSMDTRELSTEKRIPYKGEILKQALADITSNVTETSEGEFIPFEITMAILHSALEKHKSTLNTSGINIPNSSIMVDTSTLDINKPVFHNNTDLTIGVNVREFLDEFGAMLLELKDLYMQTYKGVNRPPRSRWENPVPMTDKMENQYWGISFDTNYQGVNVSPSLFPFLAVNPFGFALPEFPGVDQALYITECLIHVIIHEVNHNFVSGEGDEFTGSLVECEAAFTGIGLSYKRWKNKLYLLVKDNLYLIADYHKKYKGCTNMSVSFE